jgi:L-lactate utilization protein LutC
LSTRGASGLHCALCWQHELLSRLGLAELLDARGIARLDYVSLAAMSPDKRREAMLRCQIGITSCDWAIAETGSLLMCSRSGRERTASLLPPVHVAIVERSQIVPDLIDAIRLLGDGVGPARQTGSTLPSNAVLITGPSKTGDIELQLTTGVHGPGTWHVIVVNE